MAIRYGGAEPFDSFDRGHYEKNFCEFILNWYQWLVGDAILRYFKTSSGCLIF